MERVLLDDRQPCGLRILGPVDHEVGLALAIEGVGLRGPPERDLVQLAGTPQQVVSPSRRASIIRASPSLGPA